MSSRGENEVDLLIKDVVAASKLTPKARGTPVKPTVNNLTSLTYEQGLLPSALGEVIDLVTTPSLLDQASLTALVRSMYPVTKISKDHVLSVVAALGHGRLKPSLNLQAALLKWLIMVYHVLETPMVLGQAYAVLFNLLDTAAIRPQLAHLLALITRRKHVRPFRIQHLLNLSRQTGNDPSLVGLLRVFKDYYPEIIVGEAVRGKASAFKHPDPAWRERLDTLQEAHLQATQEKMSRPRDGFRVHRVIGRAQRNRALPSVHTSHANEDSVTLEEVENVSGFVQNMEKLELPNQLVAVLADPLLQKLLILRPSAESYQRIANWLNAVLQDVIDGDADQATLWEVLHVVRDFVVQTKNLPSIVLNFFAKFFPLWDGSGDRNCIFDILSYSSFMSFDELYKHVFQSLETAVIDNKIESQLSILTFYTNLLHHWAAILHSSDPLPLISSTSTSALVTHANSLALTIAQASPTITSESVILAFYEQVSALITDTRLEQYIEITLPPSALIYILFFSNSVATVSRICQVLIDYKQPFQTANNTQPTPHARGSIAKIDARTYDKTYINLYNGYLMDICNCFMRMHAFWDTDTNAHGCLIPRNTVDALIAYVPSVDNTFSLESLLSLSYSPILSLQSIERLRELEDAAWDEDDTLETRHAGPATQANLNRLATSGGMSLPWQEYRAQVLKRLQNNSLGGITELLIKAMKPIRDAMMRMQNKT